MISALWDCGMRDDWRTNRLERPPYIVIGGEGLTCGSSPNSEYNMANLWL